MNFIILILLVVVIIAILKKANGGRGRRAELEALILAADEEGSDTNGPARKRLLEYEQAHQISEEMHAQIRTELYRRLADAGDPRGLYEKAYMAIRDGNHTYAEKLLTESAEKGYVDAMLTLGHQYAKYGDFPTDEKKSFDWFRRAAESGNAEAMRWVGSYYACGTGVERDEEKAEQWYEKGFRLGSAACGVELARAYLSPVGKQDAAAGKQILELVMTMGDRDAFASAASELGYLFAGNRIFDKKMPQPFENPRQAAYCFYLAYAAGDNEQALENLKKLQVCVRDSEQRAWRDDARALRYRSQG